MFYNLRDRRLRSEITHWNARSWGTQPRIHRPLTFHLVTIHFLKWFLFCLFLLMLWLVLYDCIILLGIFLFYQCNSSWWWLLSWFRIGFRFFRKNRGVHYWWLIWINYWFWSLFIISKFSRWHHITLILFLLVIKLEEHASRNFLSWSIWLIALHNSRRSTSSTFSSHEWSLRFWPLTKLFFRNAFHCLHF